MKYPVSKNQKSKRGLQRKSRSCPAKGSWRKYRRRNPDLKELREKLDKIRDNINTFRKNLSHYFVDKSEIIDLMTICTIAQEPLLIVGPPGTGKSDLITKFCQSLGGFDVEKEYFEYMLTKFTEPAELLGPVNLKELKEGKYIRKVEGMLPTAKIAFLDEIFKANSAILNTMLTILNERKFYQDGKAVPAKLLMLFAATNNIPDFEELSAIRDRFTIKVESLPTVDKDQLLEKGVGGEIMKKLNVKPWSDRGVSLDDFINLNEYLFKSVSEKGEAQDVYTSVSSNRKKFFPNDLYALFKQVLQVLEVEDGIYISDRKFIKIYNLIRARALLFHGGVVRLEDLSLLKYIGNRSEDFDILREKVPDLLRLG